MLFQQVEDSQYAQATPDGKGIERAGIGVVALTRLHRHLIQINHDGKTCHEEEEEHHPELLDTDRQQLLCLLSVLHHLALAGVPCLPEETDETQYQRHAVEHVVSLILLQVIRQLALVAQHGVVDKRNARNPVAMLWLAVALNVVLSSGKVPHEVAPVHEVALVGEEEAYVVPL